MRTRRASCLMIMGIAGLVAMPAAPGQTVSLYTAVDLALRNSSEIRMAEADLRRADAGVSESHDAYLPSFLFSTNLGYSYGFPVGQPSIANLQTNSLLLSFSQPDYVRSARAAREAAQLTLNDARERVALEASLAYVELSSDSQQIDALRDQRGLGERLIQIERERVAAGLDSRVDETRARLTNAQLAVRLLQLQGHAEIVSERIANLTGLPLERITADPQSVPTLMPGLPKETLLLRPMQESNGVQSAYASAKSKLFTAFGDERTVDRPTLALGLQYARYAEFNNYNQYYLRFQHNNFGVGINVSIPLFDEVKRAHARGTAAEAAHAKAEADQMRSQQAEQRLETAKNIETLNAQQTVADLQQQLAQDQLDAVILEQQDGTGHAGSAPVTPKDEQQARIDERRFTVELLDAKLQLIEAELNMLRSNDQLVAWAMQVPKP